MKSISVIIPTYGGNESLKRAIDSVLIQNYDDFEIIVVDDNEPGSQARNATEKIMEEYAQNKRLKYLRHERNKNGAAARNTGAREARGELITFLDDDDCFLSNKLLRQAEYLEAHREYDAVYCWRISEGREICGELTGDLSEALLDLSFSPCTCALMMWTAVYRELGGFDEDFYRHQDFEFLLRFFEKHRIGVAKEVLVEIIGNSVDNQPRGMRAVELKEKFLRTFSERIEQLDIQNPGFKQRVYARHYSELLLKLLRYGDVKLAVKVYFDVGRKGGIALWKEFAIRIWGILSNRVRKRMSK